MSKEPRLERLTDLIKKLRNNPNPTIHDYHDIVLMGHSVYKSGLGLPTDHVLEAIKAGIDNDSEK